MQLVNYKYYILLLLLLNCSTKAVPHNVKEINIKDFGAVGDGTTNDYAAFVKAVDYLNQLKTGILYFPEGTYYLDKYAESASELSEIVFSNLINVKIVGDNAKILLKGNFHRGFDQKIGSYSYSHKNAIIPFSFKDCSKITIQGIEIDGNASTLTRDKHIVESGSKGHLIRFVRCDSVLVENIYVHHAQTDGFNIIRSSNFEFNKVISKNNARQGMTISSLINGVFSHCEFSNTGETNGLYGGDAPKAGLDIEPHHKGEVNQNIKFLNCKFKDNKGSQIVISTTKQTKDIFFINCEVIITKPVSQFGVIVNSKNVHFQDCYFDLYNSSIYPAWSKNPTSAYFDNCIIKSSGRGIMASEKNTLPYLSITNSKIIYTGKNRIKSYFPFIVLTNFHFENSTIIIPKDKVKLKGFDGLIKRSKQIRNIKINPNSTVKPNILLE